MLGQFEIWGVLPLLNELDIPVSGILQLSATDHYHLLATKPVLSECRRQLFRAELLDVFGAEPDVLTHA